MSIVTLKRTTQAKYNNNSVGYKNFSINGVYRLQGYVGQDSRSRNLIKTPYGGATIPNSGNNPRGGSACCGKYPNSIVYPSGINYFENNTIIKPSSLSTRGLIATKYRWITRPQPFTSVKPDTNLLLNNSEGAYVENLQRTVLNNIVNSTPSIIYNVDPIGIRKYKNYQIKQLCNPITKSVGPIDESLYILNVDKACSNETITNIPYSVQKTPFTGFTAN